MYNIFDFMGTMWTVLDTIQILYITKLSRKKKPHTRVHASQIFLKKFILYFFILVLELKIDQIYFLTIKNMPYLVLKCVTFSYKKD